MALDGREGVGNQRRCSRERRREREIERTKRVIERGSVGGPPMVLLARVTAARGATGAGNGEG